MTSVSTLNMLFRPTFCLLHSPTGWTETRSAQKLLVRVKFTGNPQSRTRTGLVSMWMLAIETHANSCLHFSKLLGVRAQSTKRIVLAASSNTVPKIRATGKK